MELNIAVDQLAALAQENRLAVFRLLVRAGHQGLAAGEIARRLEVPPNTLSAQLNLLASAKLIVGQRQGRSIIYSVQFDRIGQLLVYLLEDCCQGRADVRAPVIDAAKQAGCCPT